MLKLKETGFLLGLPLLLSACAVGPDYRPPPTPVPTAWRHTSAVSAETTDLRQWWRIFNDPLLTRLIEQAQVGNRDVHQALARLREARARRQLAWAELWPTSSASAAASQRGSSKAAGFSSGTTGIGMTNELYSYSLDASWELDIFGKRRRGVESAVASQQAAQEDLRDVLVSLCAEVALNYVDLRGLQQRLAIAEANLASQTDIYDIARWRRLAGLTTQLDVDQAKLSVDTTGAELPGLRSSLRQAKHNLALLLGRQPTALDAQLALSAPIPVASGEVGIGIPADLLRRRPDVRRAERQLAAQTAQIGVAEAARYPDFTLSGSIGLESLLYSNLYSAAAKTFQMAGQTVLVLLDAGRIRANIDIQTALQKQALGLYEATLLTALRDVENALAAYVEERKRRGILTAAVAAGRSAKEQAEAEYVAGISDFQRVLDTQRSLLDVQLQLAGSEAEVAADLIRLYKALGGGWQPENFQEKTEHDR